MAKMLPCPRLSMEVLPVPSQYIYNKYHYNGYDITCCLERPVWTDYQYHRNRKKTAFFITEEKEKQPVVVAEAKLNNNLHKMQTWPAVCTHSTIITHILNTIQ